MSWNGAPNTASGYLSSLTLSFVTALASGGAIYARGAQLSVSESKFLNCRAQSGGCIELSGSGIRIANSTFSGSGHFYHSSQSYTAGAGGAIGASGNSAVTTSSCRFSGFSASASEGALLVSGSSTLLSQFDVFQSNAAVLFGGVALLQTGSTGHFQHAVFTSQLAEQQGGALAVLSESSVTCTHCPFQNSTAGIQGGAILVMDSSFVADHSTFSFNSAPIGDSY